MTEALLTMKAIEFSLVIPAYNEEARIIASLQRVLDHYSLKTAGLEIVVVDDGSTDNTRALCTEYAAYHPEVVVIGYQINRGKGYAVKTGVLSTRGRYVAFCDADLPVPPEDFKRFVEASKRGYDLVIGSRYLPAAEWEMPIYRRLLGWGFRLLVKIATGIVVTDSQFGFKLFTGRAAKLLFASLTTDGFAFDAEILSVAQRLGFRIKELPVRGIHSPGSKVRPVRDTLCMLAELTILCLRRDPYWFTHEADVYSRTPPIFRS